MTYTLEMTRKSNHLYCTMGGDANTVEDVLELAGKVLAEAKDFGCFRIVFDERDVTLNLDQHDVYQCTEALSDYLPAEGVRVAVIHNNKDLDIYHCFETMLRNRSINYKLFDDVPSALEWLNPQ